jgi:hypothetical protein
VRQLDIGENDRRQDRLAGEIHPQQSADRAVCPVRPDQILCPPTGLQTAIVRLGSHRYLVGALFEADDFEAAPDHRPLPGGVGTQRLVDVGLRGDHRKPVGRVEVGQVDAGAAENRYTGGLV